MKKILIVAALLLLAAGFADAKAKRFGHANFEIFYSSLSPYGEWIEVDFGYVWRPLHVRYGWRPYMDGRWVWSRHGWYWVSNEPFGWATFHYGRWSYDDYYGWIWIPDDVWGPAWVEWRYDDDYIGWAPLPPQAFFDFSVGIRFGRHWSSPWHHWNFVACRNFTRTHMVEYIQPSERSRRIFGRTRTTGEIRMDGDRIVNRGIDRDFVERRSRTRIEETDVVRGERERSERLITEGGRGRVETFAPRLDRGTNRESSRPADVRRAERPIRIDGMERPEDARSGNRRDEYRGGTRDRERSGIDRERTPQRRSEREYVPRGGSEERTPQAERNRSREYERPSVRMRDESGGRESSREAPAVRGSARERSYGKEPRTNPAPGRSAPAAAPSIKRSPTPERPPSPSRDGGRQESKSRGTERRGRP